MSVEDRRMSILLESSKCLKADAWCGCRRLSVRGAERVGFCNGKGRH